MKLILEDNIFHNGQHLAKGEIVDAEELGLTDGQLAQWVEYKSVREYIEAGQVAEGDEVAALRLAMEAQADELMRLREENARLKQANPTPNPLADENDRHRQRATAEAKAAREKELGKLTKDKLVALAIERGFNVEESATKGDLVEALIGDEFKTSGE